MTQSCQRSELSAIALPPEIGPLKYEEAAARQRGRGGEVVRVDGRERLGRMGHRSMTSGRENKERTKN